MFFDNQKGVYTLKKKIQMSNHYSLIFVAICGKIQDHFVIATFKTELKTHLRFDVYACLDKNC